MRKILLLWLQNVLETNDKVVLSQRTLESLGDYLQTQMVLITNKNPRDDCIEGVLQLLKAALDVDISVKFVTTSSISPRSSTTGDTQTFFS